MNYTENYKLSLPEGRDPLSRLPFNRNFQTLDTELHALFAQVNTTLWDGGNRWRSYKWVPGLGAAINSCAEETYYPSKDMYFNVRVSDEIVIADDGSVSLGAWTVGIYTPEGTPVILPGSGGGSMTTADFPFPNKYVQVQPVSMRGNGEPGSAAAPTVQTGEWSAVAWAEEGAGATIVSDGDQDSATVAGMYAVIPHKQFQGLVSSEDASAYPADGWQNHVYYVKAPASTVLTPKLEIGSYTGTGLSGKSNPTELAFAIKPYVVLVQPENGPAAYGSETASKDQTLTLLRGVTDYVDTATALTVVWSDYGVSFYGDSAVVQRNSADSKYHYVAIGYSE